MLARAEMYQISSSFGDCNPNKVPLCALSVYEINEVFAKGSTLASSNIGLTISTDIDILSGVLHSTHTLHSFPSVQVSYLLPSTDSWD